MLLKSEKYRPGVVAVIRNNENQVLLFERSDHGTWQFPQGGVEKGETLEDALFRELLEEVGKNDCRIIKVSDDVTRYKWPEGGRKNYVGQEHKWFLVEYSSNEIFIPEKADGSFKRCQWIEAEKGISMVVEWKQPSYRKGLKLLDLL